MYHSHQNEDHARLESGVDHLIAAADDLYINHHNGDKKLNRRIMRVVKLLESLKETLSMHSANTINLDDDYAKGQESLKREAEREVTETERKSQRRNNTIRTVLTILGTVAAGALLNLLTK